MARAEQEGLPYLFKLRTTRNVKRLLERVMAEHDWEPAGQGWQGKEAALRLDGWGRARRVVLLRRRLPRELAAAARPDGQLSCRSPRSNRRASASSTSSPCW